ncbi:MAG: FAD:protein FMN transferase [Planctomycetaceae bacterium]
MTGRLMTGSEKNRRDLLFGGSVEQPGQPSAGATLRLSIHAMACEFGAAVNLDQTAQLLSCGDGLEVVPEIEAWLSVYQSSSELTRLNASAGSSVERVSHELFDVLQQAAELHRATHGAFDMASGAQIQLWRRCRAEQRIPTENEIRDAVAASGMHQLDLSADDHTVSFRGSGLSLDPGAIGKGYALDQAAHRIEESENGARDFLIYGGRSSVLAHGEHNSLPGWPVGIGNPLLTKRRLGTVILRNQAMSTSGSNIQFFRCGGRRFGHILDPRSGWPVEGMVSVTVIADSAAVADAVSTAFFVLGVENAIECCDNLKGIGAILVPFPEKGARVEPVVIGIPREQLYWDEALVALS